jgi:hypothetical protein
MMAMRAASEAREAEMQELVQAQSSRCHEAELTAQNALAIAREELYAERAELDQRMATGKAELARAMVAMQGQAQARGMASNMVGALREQLSWLNSPASRGGHSAALDQRRYALEMSLDVASTAARAEADLREVAKAEAMREAHRDSYVHAELLDARRGYALARLLAHARSKWGRPAQLLRLLGALHDWHFAAACMGSASTSSERYRSPAVRSSRLSRSAFSSPAAI